MNIAHFIGIIFSDDTIQRVAKTARAYWDWYRYGHVCIHAIENSVTGAYASFTIQRETGYSVALRWFDASLHPIDVYATSDKDALFYTYWNVICPMVTSSNVGAQCTRRTATGLQETCYITETGVYYLTLNGNELIHVYRL